MEAWSQYLPKYGDPPFKLGHDGPNGPSNLPNQPNGGVGSNGGGGGAGSEESTAPSEDEDADEEDDEDDANSSAVQAKRNQVKYFSILDSVALLTSNEGCKRICVELDVAWVFLLFHHLASLLCRSCQIFLAKFGRQWSNSNPSQPNRVNCPLAG